MVFRGWRKQNSDEAPASDPPTPDALTLLDAPLPTGQPTRPEPPTPIDPTPANDPVFAEPSLADPSLIEPLLADPSANPDTTEGLARKQASEDLLVARGVPINEMLPRIESESESARRDDFEVAYRAMALMAVAMKGEGHAAADPQAVRDHMASMIETFGLHKFFSDNERDFIDAHNPPEFEWIQFSWRYEACWVMHWALGFVDELAPPTGQCNPATTVSMIQNRGRDRYLDEAQLRPQAEILDQADLMFRYHWAVRDAHHNGGTVPGVQRGVVMERHHALNWLIGVGDNWDDVPTDT